MDKTNKGLNDKLCEIQTRLVAPKSQFNAFGKYKYRKCEDILEAVKPLLKEMDLVLLINDELVLIGERYYVKATASLCDAKGGSIQVSGYAREPGSHKGMDDSQVTGATSSYARKYALNGLFCIDDTKDADSTNEHKNGENKGDSMETYNTVESVKKKISKVITEKQGKRLLAIAIENGFSRNLVKDYVFHAYNIEHLRDIPQDKYEAICEHFERGDNG